jgi:hypothetical protein
MTQKSEFKKCPICGADVKAENLARHKAIVHSKKNPLRNPILIIFVLVSLVASVAIYSYPRGEEEQTVYIGEPKIQVTPSYYNFGDISAADGIVKHTFSVENTGTGLLEINSIKTNCGCTKAYLVANGRKSPTFGMRGNPVGWSHSIEPGQSADLVVTYDPNYHRWPDQGLIRRVVEIKSNDPEQPEVKIRITANVKP